MATDTLNYFHISTILDTKSMTNEEKDILLNEQYGSQLKELAVINENAAKILCNCAVTIHWLSQKNPELAALLPFSAVDTLGEVQSAYEGMVSAEQQIERIEVLADVKEFVKPTGAHDAYKKGDKVVFEGDCYESLLDANVWSPAEYAQGWRKL